VGEHRVAVIQASQSIDYHAVLPPLIVAVGAAGVLVADLFTPPARKRRVCGALTMAVLLAALVATGTLWQAHWTRPRATFCLPSRPDLCSYQADRFTVVLQLIALGGAVLVTLMSMTALADGDADRRVAMPPGEYLFLLLSSVTGVLLLVAARDLVTLVVAFEVVTLPAFALVGLRRRDARGGEAALKFFLVSVVGTAVTLLGVSLLYGVTGQVHLPAVADALRAGAGDRPGFRPITQVAVVLTLVGFGVKISAVPFHAWTPDAYTGAPVPVAGYLSVVSKTAGLAGLILVAEVAFGPDGQRVALLLGVLAAVTMTVGNLVALRQRHAVRLLAYSTIAQAGYLLVPLAGNASGYPTGTDRAGPTVAYLTIYAAINLGAFAVVTVAAGAGATWLTDYRGLARRRPLLGGALAFFLLCLAGLPPGLAGLFAKVAIVRAATAGGVTWLAVITGVNVVLGLAYYLPWLVQLYTAPAAGERPEGVHASPRPAARPATAAAGLALAVTVLLSVWPQPALRALGPPGQARAGPGTTTPSTTNSSHAAHTGP
jgi:NADH-quinone oxidoreductase subunit N